MDSSLLKLCGGLKRRGDLFICAVLSSEISNSTQIFKNVHGVTFPGSHPLLFNVSISVQKHIVSALLYTEFKCKRTVRIILFGNKSIEVFFFLLAKENVIICFYLIGEMERARTKT